MPKSVLLYNPPASKDEASWMRPIPLNLLACASLLDEQKYKIVIVQEFPKQAVKEFEPFFQEAIILGISCKTGSQIAHGLEVAQFAKKVRPDLKIVWGGYHPSSLAEQTLQNPFVDIVVRGYGEETFAQLVKCFDINDNLQTIPGISFKQKNGVVLHNPEAQIPDLNALPPLPYHLFDVEKFFAQIKARDLHYISSRGCPHQCGFCADLVIYKRRWNALSAERVVSDLERLKKIYNFERVRFYDSNLFVSEQRIKEICQGVLEKNLKFEWFKCNGDSFILSKYSKETLSLMKQAGISNILIGIESGYEPALKLINKTATHKDNLKTKELLSGAGISIAASMIFGFPYDLPKEKLEREHTLEIFETMKEIATFSKNYVPGDYFHISVFTPFPGVRLFPYYLKLGYQPPQTFEAWSEVSFSSYFAPWISPRSLALYQDCLALNWFLMHKIERNCFSESKNKFLRKFAWLLDKKMADWVRKRISQGKLYLPISLVVVKAYFSSRNIFKTRGHFLFFKAILKKFRH